MCSVNQPKNCHDAFASYPNAFWESHPQVTGKTTISSPSFLSAVSPSADDETDPEASEFDLGTKIKTPKDTMLEELSLMKNKGSKMFRMRQQRVEKFIVTNENMVHTRAARTVDQCTS